MTRTFRIGTRGSALALVQARWVAARLAEHGIPTDLVIVRTEGDDRPVDTAWGEGAFVGRIIEALVAGSVDLAVHSAKDVPTDERPDLVIAAYPPREDPRDALVCRVRGSTLATLPEGSRVGTDSPRRTAFVRALRPDLSIHPLHGNVDTRLAKMDRAETDALVLAVAGLQRLGRDDRIDEVFPVDTLAPAPGQGALAIQVRAADAGAIDAAARLDDAATRIAVVAERHLLRATGGGCRSAIGAIGRLYGDRLQLVAGAARTWTPADGAGPGEPSIAWVRGEASPERSRAMAEHLAARIVALRTRPRVLVARTPGQAALLVGALERVGLDAVNVPAIEIRQLDAGGPLDAALGQAAPGTWVVLTSAHAAVATLAAVRRTGVDPSRLRWAAVGRVTADTLRPGGIERPFVPSTPTGTVLAQELPVEPDDRVLLPRGDAADDSLPDALRRRGALVEEVTAYRTLVAPDASRPLLAAAFDDGPFDAIVLSSGSTARGILALAADETRARLLRTPTIAIGESTRQAAANLGFETVIVAPATDVGALAASTAAMLRVRARPTDTGGTA